MDAQITPEIHNGPRTDLGEGRIVLGYRIGKGTFAQVFHAWYAEKKHKANDGTKPLEYYPEEEVAAKVQYVTDKPQKKAESNADAAVLGEKYDQTLLYAEVDTRNQVNGRILQARLKEVQAMILLSQENPHIVPIIKYGVDAKGRFITLMPFYKDGSLRNWNLNKKPLNPLQHSRILTQIASALQCAHNHRIIHRDVKPDNILFKSPNETMLADFGIAHPQIPITASEQRNMKSFQGTLPYMAPEQMLGQTSEYSDQYALGIIVYEMQVKRTPYIGDSVNIIKGQLSPEAVPFFRDITKLRNTPEQDAVETVIRTALSKDWRYRYPSVTAFDEAYQDALFAYYQRRHSDKVAAFPDVPKRVNAKRYAEEAASLYNQKQYELAIQVFDQAIALDPNSITSHYQKSLTLEAMNRSADARLALIPIINCPVRSNADFVMKGYAYAHFNQNEEAELAYQQAIDRGYNNRAVFEYLAMSFDEIGKKEELSQRYADSQNSYYQALSLYDKAMQVDPHHLANYDTYKRKVRIFEILEKPEDALASLDNAIALDPENSENKTLYEHKTRIF